MPQNKQSCLLDILVPCKAPTSVRVSFVHRPRRHPRTRNAKHEAACRPPLLAFCLFPESNSESKVEKLQKVFITKRDLYCTRSYADRQTIDTRYTAGTQPYLGHNPVACQPRRFSHGHRSHGDKNTENIYTVVYVPPFWAIATGVEIDRLPSPGQSILGTRVHIGAQVQPWLVHIAVAVNEVSPRIDHTGTKHRNTFIRYLVVI